MAFSRPHHIRIWLLALGGVLALYAILGFFLVPAIAGRQIERSGSTALNRPVTLDDVRFNPFTFAMEVDGLRVGERTAETPLLALERGRFNFDAFESLVRWQWQFGEIVLTAPRARLAVSQNGELNIADLFGGDQPRPPEDASGLKFGVDSLVVTKGLFEFEDRSRDEPYATVIQPIAFTLEDFTTEPGRGGVYRLSGQTEAGEGVTWSGQIAVAPFASSGRVEFTSLNLPSYQPLLSDVLGGEIRSGRVDLAASYEFRTGEQPAAQLRDVTMRATEMAAGLPNEPEPAITMGSLAVSAPEVDLLAKRARVAEVTLSAFGLRVVREAGGSIDLQRLVRTARVEPAADARPEAPVHVLIERVALQDGRVQFTDRTTGEPAELRADQIAVTLTNVTTDRDAEAGVELGLRWQEGPGTLTAKGTLRREPWRADVQVNGTRLELAALTPYLQPYARAEIVAGTAELDGRLVVSQTASDPLAVSWTGQTAVNALAVREPESGQEVLRWAHFGLVGGEVSLAPQRLSAREIRLESPALSIVRGDGGAINLTALFGGDASADEAGDSAAQPPPSGASDQASETPASPRTVAIESFTVADGSVTFTDRAFEPSTRSEISGIAGSLRGLSTERGEAGRLELTASVLGSAQAKIEGTVNVIGSDALSGSDVALDVRAVRLEPLEPYVVRFLGHRVQQGEMRGDFAYRVSAGTIDGSNRVVLDDFFLGEAVDSPDALNVPVKLALAVLRNRDGQIVLEVPVSGSLRSPEFDLGQTIRGAFRNVLGRVATAPFALLGSMFGAPDADLGQLDFPPARTDFTDDARRKLDILARALQDRPTLKLIVRSAPAPAIDREPLRQQRLAELLRQQQEQIASDEGGNLAEPQVLRSLYATRVLGVGVGQLSEGGSPPAPPESGEQDAWYARFWHWFWGPWPEHDAPPPSSDATPTAPEFPQVSEAQMREELLQTIQLDPEAFTTVARDRANAVRDHLVGTGLGAERVEVEPASAEPAPESATAARVTFTLEEVAARGMAEPDSGGEAEAGE